MRDSRIIPIRFPGYAFSGLVLLVATALLPAEDDPRSAGTRKMAERLKQFAENADPEKVSFLNPQRAVWYRRKAESSENVSEKLRFRMMSAYELVLAGKTEEGVEELLAVRAELSKPELRVSPRTLRNLGDLLAIAYLRLGEQENCVARHGPDSCLMPIRGTGVHVLPRGSRSAIAELRTMLNENHDDLKSRWLLNLAHMTLGEYPDKVPPSDLIPPRVFDSDIPFPRFFDAAPQAGVAAVGLSGGSITEDFDGDGDLDIMASAWGLTEQIQYFRNNADGTFTNLTESAGLIGEVGGLNICHADYDNDGDNDVFVLRGAWLREQGRLPNSLLRNNGRGFFEDVTEEAGLLSFAPTQAGSWADFDRDGHLDLVVGNESTADDPYPCELYRNNGDGSFTNVAEMVGVNYLGFVKAAVWGDYDNDGLPDLYLSCLGAPNVLFHNDGPLNQAKNPSTVSPQSSGAAQFAQSGWRFTDVTATAGVSEPLRSFPAWFWDYDNDGWEDLLVAPFSVFLQDSLPDIVKDYLGQPHQGETPRLYHNQRNGTFKDVTRESRLNRVMLAMGANFGDLDNDGWLDAYFGTGDPLLTTLTPNRMFRNNEGKGFQDVTTAGGFGHLQKGHGVSFADLDNDGDQDIYHVLGGAFTGDVFQNALFENPGFGNRWITLRLEGTKSNRSAIGARIKVSVTTPTGDRDIRVSVTTGGSFGSSSLQQEIGLGQATSIREIQIHWPCSGVQKLNGLTMDKAYRIREGDSEAISFELPRFDLSPLDPNEAPCPHHPIRSR